GRRRRLSQDLRQHPCTFSYAILFHSCIRSAHLAAGVVGKFLLERDTICRFPAVLLCGWLCRSSYPAQEKTRAGPLSIARRSFNRLSWHRCVSCLSDPRRHEQITDPACRRNARLLELALGLLHSFSVPEVTAEDTSVLFGCEEFVAYLRFQRLLVIPALNLLMMDRLRY